MTRISRRDFVRLGTAGAVAGPLILDPTRAHAATTTAQELVDLIRTSLGVEWRADTVDTFKAGDPSTIVTGIATTSLVTIDVMRRAVKAGANMIITSGPTFYSRADRPDAAGWARSWSCGNAAPRPGIRGQERIHQDEQPGRLAVQRPLAPAYAGPVRHGFDRRARVDEKPRDGESADSHSAVDAARPARRRRQPQAQRARRHAHRW